MKKFKDKWLFKLAKRLIDNSPECPNCHGRGYLYSHQKLDDITTLDENTPCVVCDTYGHYPFSWFTKLVIKQLPD